MHPVPSPGHIDVAQVGEVAVEGGILYIHI
jgi:hypothetical protein